jgi:hypothetical protein
VSPKATADDDASLKRLPGGGGWQTRDGRFTIATASGTWSLLDAEQTDDLGLPLVRGPFRSLADAKAAIETARGSEPAKPSLAGRAAKQSENEEPQQAKAPAKPPAKSRKPAPPEEPAEPRWVGDLEPADRRRARRLLNELEKLGVRDAEGIVRRDLAGDVPAVARLALARQVSDALGDADAAATKVARRIVDVIVDGRDDALDVRWRLVDDDGRPIGLTAEDVTAARKRAAATD